MKLLHEEKLKELLTLAWADGYANAAQKSLRTVKGQPTSPKATEALELMVAKLMEGV